MDEMDLRSEMNNPGAVNKCGWMSTTSPVVEGGGSLKRSFSSRTLISQSMSAPLSFHSSRLRLKRKTYESGSRSLQRNRLSMPTLVAMRAASRPCASSNQNEEWDVSTTRRVSSDASMSTFLKLLAASSTFRPSTNDEESNQSNSPQDSCVISQSECPIQPDTEDEQHVTFSDSPEFFYHDTCHSPPHDIKWYLKSENDQFLNAAIDRSRVVERTMKYASLNESTYNSSTGLPSPQVLKEYLSHPEEIIGIEHMLSCQKCARNSLKRSCTKTLLDETRRQRQEGCVDPHLLAERLMITSNISAHMAQQRAAYITLLD